MRIEVRRVYSIEEDSGLKRVLVDRLWPRGAKKSRVDIWMREIAPSDQLRKWYRHDQDRWEEFKRRYFIELDSNMEITGKLLSIARRDGVILLYASREERYNNAEALKEYLVRAGD